MESMVIIIAALVLLITGVLVWRKNKWHVIAAEEEMNEELSRQYDYLKRNNIRCRVRQQAASTGYQAGIAASGQASSETVIVLEIHKQDLEKALQLLEQFSFSEGFKL